MFKRIGIICTGSILALAYSLLIMVQLFITAVYIAGAIGIIYNYIYGIQVIAYDPMNDNMFDPGIFRYIFIVEVIYIICTGLVSWLMIRIGIARFSEIYFRACAPFLIYVIAANVSKSLQMYPYITSSLLAIITITSTSILITKIYAAVPYKIRRNK